MKFANARVTELFGYSVDEMANMPFANFVLTDDLDIVAGKYLARIRGEAVEPVYDFRVITRDGRTRWAEMHSALVDWEGRPATLNFLSDITDRKQAEDQIKKSEENYRLVVDNALEGIVIVQDRMVKFVNDVLSKLLDYSKDEILSSPFIDFVHPDDRGIVTETHTQRLQGKAVPDLYSFRLAKRSGEAVWIELRGVTVDWEGRSATLNFLSDLTERKKAEQALIESEHKYSSILDEMGEGYYESDLNGNFTFFNNALAEHSGFTADELRELNYKTFVPGEETSKVFELYNEVFRTGEPRLWQPVTFVRKDGTRLHVENSVYPVKNRWARLWDSGALCETSRNIRKLKTHSVIVKKNSVRSRSRARTSYIQLMRMATLHSFHQKPGISLDMNQQRWSADISWSSWRQIKLMKPWQPLMRLLEEKTQTKTLEVKMRTERRFAVSGRTDGWSSQIRQFYWHSRDYPGYHGTKRGRTGATGKRGEIPHGFRERGRSYLRCHR